MTLREVMSLAADRDSVAAQYANGFADVLDLAVPTLSRRIAEGRPLETAIIGGARMVRVHDVRMTVHAARVVAKAV